MESYLIIGIFIFSFIIVRPFIIFIHEIGHAIPALLFTKNKVTIYIGSYGDSLGSFGIQLKKLKIYIKRNIFKWRSGVCIPHGSTSSLIKNICIYASGTLFCVIIAGILTFIAFYYNLSDLLKLFSFFFSISAMIELPRNLIASNTPITLFDGSVTYNDGQLIANLKKNRKILLQSFLKSEITSLLDSKDYFNSAEIKRKDGNFQEAIMEYTKAINMAPSISYYYHNRGYTYLEFEHFEKAIIDFTKAIELEPKEAFAYNNRGHAKIMLGNLNQGLVDVLKSLELNDYNPYVYRNLGIYHFKKKELDKALDLFNYTFSIDKETPLLIEYINKVNEIMNET